MLLVRCSPARTPAGRGQNSRQLENARPPGAATESLAQRYPTFILVNRETFTLRLFKHLKLVRDVK